VAIAAQLDEDLTGLIAEANLGDVDPEIRLSYLIARLVKSKDEEKLTKLVEFVESLR
jgi:hypothetical protein